jgi:hypothetical protein
MATSGKDTGIVGYNVQIAVDTQHHLIVAHEVTNVGTDRHQLQHGCKFALRRHRRRSQQWLEALRAASRICSHTGAFCRDAAEQWEPADVALSPLTGKTPRPMLVSARSPQGAALR